MKLIQYVTVCGLLWALAAPPVMSADAGREGYGKKNAAPHRQKLSQHKQRLSPAQLDVIRGGQKNPSDPSGWGDGTPSNAHRRASP